MSSSSFKVKLKRPSQSAGSSAAPNSAKTSSGSGVSRAYTESASSSPLGPQAGGSTTPRNVAKRAAEGIIDAMGAGEEEGEGEGGLEDEEEEEEDDDEEEEEDEERDELEGDSDDAAPDQVQLSIGEGAVRGSSSTRGGRGKGKGGSKGGSSSSALHPLAKAKIKKASALSVEEIDSMPPAKRRKSHKARGAPGPGRGWRKGLKMGQKPVYTGPDGLAAAEATPSSFAGSPSAESRLASPAVSLKEEKKPTSTKIAAASPSTKMSAPGAGPIKANVASTGAASSAQDAKNSSNVPRGTSGVRYPPLPAAKSGPTILPLARIPIGFANPASLDRTAQKVPRKWIKKPRQILSLGGRVWTAPTWISDVPPKLAPPNAEGAAASSGSGGIGSGSAKKDKEGDKEGGKSRPSSPAAARIINKTAPATSSPLASRKSQVQAQQQQSSEDRDGPDADKAQVPGSPPRGASSGGPTSPKNPKLSATKAKSSLLAPPTPATKSATKADTSTPSGTTSPIAALDWRGSSPAFRAGARH